MRRVLAVLVSVLVAGWPLLLPQPTSAGSPCSNNGAKVYAGSSATNIPIAAAVQIQDQNVNGDASGDSYAGDAKIYSDPTTAGGSTSHGEVDGGDGGDGAYGDGGKGTSAALGLALQIPIAKNLYVDDHNEADADASQKTESGNATGGAGTGGAGGAGGSASNSDSADAVSVVSNYAKGGSADRWAKASGSQDADAYAGNKGNSASAGDVDVDAGGASGDPCKQIIKDSVGVMAINGANYLKGNVMQNVNANLGNAANTSVNMGELMPQQDRVVFPAWGEGPYVPDLNGPGQTPTFNINVNPNTNQNTNIISF